MKENMAGLGREEANRIPRRKTVLISQNFGGGFDLVLLTELHLE